MEDNVIRTIFVNIVQGVGGHGHFLTYFAKAYLQADAENAGLLRDVAVKLIRKYYLDRILYMKEGS